MRRLAMLIAVALLSGGVSACGSANSASSGSGSSAKTTTAAVASSSAAPVETQADADRDNDIGAPADDTNNNDILDYGHPASAADKQAVTSLVERYYAAGAAGNGAAACSMLFGTLAKAVPEDYGSPPGPLYSRGSTCPTVMALTFKHFHSQLALELPLLKVARVRLQEPHGLVVLNFGRLPERQISVDREGHTWRIDGLLDSELP